MSEESDSKKALGRFHDVWMLLLTFALTTFVGGVLTARYQRKNAESVTSQILLQTQQTDATRVFEDVSRDLDMRLFRWRRLFWAVRDSADLASINRERQDYREAVNEWNYSLNGNQAMLCRYFGAYYGREFLGISDEINYLHKVLADELSKAKPERKGFPALERRANALNTRIFRFDRDLVEKIRTARVGRKVSTDSLETQCGIPKSSARDNEDG